MEIYNAIMKAADQIEAHPEQFNFMSIDVPDGCGTPGCALGWITAFAGLRVRSCGGFDAAKVQLGLGQGYGAASMFYARMDACLSWWDSCRLKSWRGDAETCAKTMRRYAKKYHAPAPAVHSTKRVGIPASVRAIFHERTTV